MFGRSLRGGMTGSLAEILAVKLLRLEGAIDSEELLRYVDSLAVGTERADAGGAEDGGPVRKPLRSHIEGGGRGPGRAGGSET